MGDSVLYEVDGGLALITLNRPERLNALDRATMRQLGQVALAAASDHEVRAVLIRGVGRGFCAGGDVKAMATGAMAEDGETPLGSSLTGAAELHRAVGDLYRAPKPVISAVHGAVAGAGVGLALAADIVLAAHSTTFTLAYTGIGLSPDGGTTFFLPRAVGLKAAAELFMTNRKVHAEEALHLGLCSRVLPDEGFAEASLAFAHRLAQGPTKAYAEVKTLLRSSLQHGFETQTEEERWGIGRSFRTEDLMEGILAFSERRAPHFQGR